MTTRKFCLIARTMLDDDNAESCSNCQVGTMFQVGTDVGTEFAAWSMMYDAG
jgi:hypothetical protein